MYNIEKGVMMMKKYIEPILLVTVEILALVFIDFDRSAIFLLGVFGFGYFFIRRAINQNEGVMQARGHKILAGNFKISPFDTHTLQKGIELEKQVSNKHSEPIQVKWIHLGLCLVNVLAITLVLLDVIAY